MNKELEALKELKNVFIGHCRELNCEENYIKVCENYFDIIEKELKEKEQQDSVFKILKEVIEFKRMLPHIEPNKDNGFDIMSAVRINIQRDIENKERELLRKWVLETCFPKELKALNEILALHDKWLANEMSDFEFFTLLNEITTKYDLLKEVLL